MEAKKAVCLVNQVLNNLKVEKHPEKTFSGRASNGFDFLGYHLTWTLDKIDVGQGATKGSSLTTLGLGYLG